MCVSTEQFFYKVRMGDHAIPRGYLLLRAGRMMGKKKSRRPVFGNDIVRLVSPATGKRQPESVTSTVFSCTGD